MPRRGLVVAGLAGALLGLVPTTGSADGNAPVRQAGPLVRVWKIHYRAHTGARRAAYVALPAWYGPRRNPQIPLVIAPHGRGLTARGNLRLWGALPARGVFAVVSPEGTGRRLTRYSWGAAGQVRDMARMPEILRRTLPWLRVDRTRVYAFGGSMGGQEVLLLLARHSRMLAGVAAFDAVTNFVRQYHSFPSIPCNRRCAKTWHGPIGVSLQSLAREEVGGAPRARRAAFSHRSPIMAARAIAASCVPLQLWWSTNDRIVSDQQHQSGALFKRIRALNPRAPVHGFVGAWKHSAEMRATTRLPAALAAFGLIPQVSRRVTSGMRVSTPPDDACSRTLAGAAP